MEPLVESQNLSVALTTPLEVDFVVDQINATEAISELYEVAIHVHTTETELAFDDLLGEVVSATISYANADTTTGDTARIFAGIVGRIHQRQTFVDEEGTTVAYYTFYLYPEFWRASLNQDCRIFQEQSVEDITGTLFDEYNITDTNVDITPLPDPERLYCLQYNESVFSFLSRLWEEEGISYFFTHNETGSMLTLINDTQSYIDPIDPDTIALQNFEKTTLVLNAIQHITYEKSIIPNEVDTTDYNDAIPSTSLNIVSPASEEKGGRIFEYPGVFGSLDQGEKLAQFRSEEITWDSAMMKGQSTVLAFSPHMSFTLAQHPRDEWNRGYILYKIEHRLRFHDPEGQNELVYDNTFWAFPDDVPFRPKRDTPKPRIYSQQTALVVGPEGEEVYTDELGRIKIQFPWDNYGNNDDASSLWVRVARTWAGPGWGAVVTPRIGMEVIVTFINGDPDRPLVMGCVYNGDNAAPYDVESPTKSIWRTQSCPATKGFNELSFEDAAGDEEIFMHAQKDVRVVIQNEREELIVNSDDTLSMTYGSKYINFYGIGMEHNIVMADGCHKYNIIKGDYSIILGNEDKMEECPTFTDLATTASAAAKAEAEAQAVVTSAAAAQAVAQAALAAAQAKADLAASNAANGTGTLDASIAAAAALTVAQAAMDTATAAYETAQADLASSQRAVNSANLNVDAYEARQILDAARAVAKAATKAQQNASAYNYQAQTTQRAITDAYQAKLDAGNAYSDHSSALTNLTSIVASKNNRASQSINRLKKALEAASASADTVKEENQKAQTIAQNTTGRANCLTEATSLKTLIDTTETEAESLIAQIATATSNRTTASSSWISGTANATQGLFATVVLDAAECANQATAVKSAADAALMAALAAYNRIARIQGNPEETEDGEPAEAANTEGEDGSEDSDSSGDTILATAARAMGAGAAAAASASSPGDASDREADGSSEDDALPPPEPEGDPTEGPGGDYTLFLEKGDATVKILLGDFNTILKSGDYTITLSGGDVTIDVTGDIDIKASGDIAIDAGGDIDISAGGDISLSADNVSTTASLMIDDMAGLAISGMAGLAVDGMAGLAVEHMALLMGGLSALLMVDVGGKVSTKVSGKAVAINLPG